MVGVKGLEPSTPWSQTRCATRLRYTPLPKSFTSDVKRTAIIVKRFPFVNRYSEKNKKNPIIPYFMALCV